MLLVFWLIDDKKAVNNNMRLIKYLLIDLGWQEHQRIYNCVIHLEIRDCKIWIQRNQTDKPIADVLIAMGVAKEDIILGLQPPYIREYTGLGVA
ncbi:MAG: hypothetical protein RLZZ535_3106 [Cyanobacteriota bacterium]|jgi:hypothetical protein